MNLGLRFFQGSLSQISQGESHSFCCGWKVGVVALLTSAWCLWCRTAHWRCWCAESHTLSLSWNQWVTDWYLRRFLRPGEKKWLVAEYGLEWGEIRRGLMERVLWETRPRRWIGSRSSGAVAEGTEVAPISWIFLSIWPLLCGWYPEDRLTVSPRSEKKDLQTCEINRETSIWYYVFRDAKVSKDMIKQYLCCFHGSWKSFQGYQTTCLGQSIHGD